MSFDPWGASRPPTFEQFERDLHPPGDPPPHLTRAQYDLYNQGMAVARMLLYSVGGIPESYGILIRACSALDRDPSDKTMAALEDALELRPELSKPKPPPYAAPEPESAIVRVAVAAVDSFVETLRRWTGR